MSKKYRFLIWFILSVLGVGLLAGVVYVLVRPSMVALLNPQGIIASKERDLIIITTLLSVIIVLPTFALTFYIAWKYRASNTKARYEPKWDHNSWLEAIWWGVPCAVILVLSAITYASSHELDPYRPIKAGAKPVTIQVVALDWKWLFIYPEQGLATVNYIKVPVNVPLNFQITADAPMNSFWIPQLGGQIYAMAGMSTRSHLLAEQPGSYWGTSANISGRGFAGMRFVAEAVSDAEFADWVAATKQEPRRLDKQTYDELAQPSEHHPRTQYGSTDNDLYTTIVMHYMAPHGHGSSASHGDGHDAHQLDAQTENVNDIHTNVPTTSPHTSHSSY